MYMSPLEAAHKVQGMWRIQITKIMPVRVRCILPLLDCPDAEGTFESAPYSRACSKLTPKPEPTTAGQLDKLSRS